MKRIPIIAFIAFLFILPMSPAPAQEKVHVAVAANFILPFQEIVALFEKKTGIRVEATYSSAGQLYAQIGRGAPYDLFFSADQERPDLLHQEGRAEPSFVYATGRVVLWSARQEFCGAADWRKAINLPGIRKIAIANPKAAPYGAAAQAALEKTRQWEHLRDKFVYAQNIAQVFQYVSTSGVEAGFCAQSSTLSEEGRKGCTYPVAEAPPIVQGACLLKRSADKNGPQALIRFLLSPEALTIKKKYGYQ
jgi:molybdate transport system substrate-binding protein